MPNENEIDDLRGQVVEMQQQLSQAAAAARMPALDMSRMMTTREYHRQLVEARSATRQPVRPQPPRLAGSIVPRAFSLQLATPDAALEAEVRRDLPYQLETAKYSQARERWWAALSGGDRRAIDRAGMELMARYAAATGAVYGVGIRRLTADKARMQAQIEFLQTQVSRLEQETRDHKQRADAMEIAHMTERPAIPAPDVHVTLALPDEIGVRVAPNPGVTLEFDEEGKVIGTRPRKSGE